MAEPIKAILILEILGRPAEHVKLSLESVVNKLSAEKGVKLIERKINEPIPVETQKDLFTTFAELTIEFNSISELFGVIFAYMPAHLEIISPEDMSLSKSELVEFSNRLIERLHGYDAVTKKSLFERNALMEKLKEVAPHLFKKPEEKKEEPAPAPEKKEKKKSKSKKKN